MDKPEQRVANALDEFEELIVEGLSIDDAAATAAASNSLRSEVLLKRAKERFGDLGTIAERAARARTAASRAAQLKHAVFEYNRLFFGPADPPEFRDVVEWVEEQLGYELSPDEASWSVGQMQEAWHRSMRRHLDILLDENRRTDA